VLTCALAVLAACANAFSSMLQRKANKRVPQRENMSLTQIRRLLHQPVWFGGILAIIAGFLLQASALGGRGAPAAVVRMVGRRRGPRIPAG
jgi:hypothetical protein